MEDSTIMQPVTLESILDQHPTGKNDHTLADLVHDQLVEMFDGEHKFLLQWELFADTIGPSLPVTTLNKTHKTIWEIHHHCIRFRENHATMRERGDGFYADDPDNNPAQFTTDLIQLWAAISQF